ncbi:Hypp3025 [Branchiostoma lanceolatum]|uniref:Hypp3025 protein n=1 Tax=Branchiostoma lanceolatum TaxID=7740 RepID=A0A8K0ESN2_BRALA|nr:Hypp3025 [Branchiostoma lanceolatum]
MADADVDEYEHYNYDADRIAAKGSGKGRSKTEQRERTHSDPSGETRKIVTNIKNAEKKEKEKNLTKQAQAAQHAKKQT